SNAPSRPEAGTISVIAFVAVSTRTIRTEHWVGIGEASGFGYRLLQACLFSYPGFGLFADRLAAFGRGEVVLNGENLTVRRDRAFGGAEGVAVHFEYCRHVMVVNALDRHGLTTRLTPEHHGRVAAIQLRFH